jgi:GTP cyclohydrolase II
LYYGQDGDERINFHVIAINCDMGRDLADADVLYNFSTDDALKLEDLEDLNAFALHRTISTSAERKQVVVRPALTGSLAFPIISTAGLDKVSSTGIKLGLDVLSQQFGYSANTDDYDDQINNLLVGRNIDIKKGTVVDGQITIKEKIVKSKRGRLYVTEIIDEHTAWKVYRIYSSVPLAKLNPKNRLFIRIDSGCSIGMNYLDGGCDCLSQLHDALDKIRDRKGIVVHLPTQDGRGYGDVTKIHTEGLKHGLEPTDRGETIPTDTVTAARIVFGNQIDIRTYSYVGEIVKRLGFSSITIFTDNFFKAYAIGRGAETSDVVIEQPDDIASSYMMDALGTLNTFAKKVRNIEEVHGNERYTDEVAIVVKKQCEENLAKDADILLSKIGNNPHEIAQMSWEDKLDRIMIQHNQQLGETN